MSIFRNNASTFSLAFGPKAGIITKIVQKRRYCGRPRVTALFGLGLSYQKAKLTGAEKHLCGLYPPYLLSGEY